MAAGAGLGGGVQAQEPAVGRLGREAAQAKATALVAQMTVEEKLGQLGSTMPEIPRLGVPAYQQWSEGLHGLWANRPVTIFPQAIGMAATFDRRLVANMGRTVAAELVAAHHEGARAGLSTQAGGGLNVWSPNINIFRDPRWGRGQETYGEDPFLTAQMGVAYVTGVQGPNPDRPVVVATPKHFAVHSGPEPRRHAIDIKVSRHDLEDTYLPAFRAAVVEGKAGSVMCAYNRVNGEPACSSDFLINQRLRGAWGFNGYLVSDCDAVEDMVTGHKYANTEAEAAAIALKAGLDTDCGLGVLFGIDDPVTKRYTAAYQQKLITDSDVDRALIRIFTMRYQLGAAGGSDPGKTIVAPPPIDHATARRAAQESLVLLKNDGLLPLKDVRKVAVVGPLADSERVLFANYNAGVTDRLISAASGIRESLPDAAVVAPPATQIPGDGVIIPSSALRSEDGRPGLTYRLYIASKYPELKGSQAERLLALASTPFPAQPEKTEVRPVVNEMRFGGASSRSLERLTWDGFIVPEESGLYRIGARTALAKVFIDGEELKAAPSDVGGAFVTKRLEAGKRYPVKISQLSIGGLRNAALMWKRISNSPVEDAVAAARSADVVVAVVGITSDLENEESPVSAPGFAGGDRTSLALPEDQLKLLQALKATGKKLIVVSMSGSAVDLSWAQENADAVIQAWYPGQEGGAALGDALTGKINPAGRLPVTFYKSVEQLPPFDDYAMAGRTYRYFAGKPLYPFGYGLSYTQFSYSALSISPLKGQGWSRGTRVDVTVANTGSYDGDEVAQLYLKFPKDPGAPNVALRGFERLHLRKGESRRISFVLSARDLSTVSVDGRHQVLGGDYQVSIGGGQPDYAITAKRGFKIRRGFALAD
jgi:beta-glucosidase